MIRLLKWFYRGNAAVGVYGTSDRITQILRLDSTILYYVGKYRQITAASTEAGGQLFGLVSGEEVQVLLATGPYRGDERSRYHYRSNSIAAQRTIEKHSKAGLLYLGEWHTHAEDYPSASESDMDAMRRLLIRSKLNVNALLMMIVGRSSGLDGLAICSFDGSVANQWKLYHDD